jgi:cystathionine gamma-synthase
MRLETLAVHTGRAPEAQSGAVTPSITLSTTFERATDGTYPHGNVYSRSGNPNRDALETALATLEGGREALAFGSGQAATAAILQTLSSGDHVILPNDLYHGTRHLVQLVLARWGLQSDFVDMRHMDSVASAIRPHTKLIWLETPSNPLLNIADIAPMAELARRVGALCVVDNTWATPIWQRPLALGADVVMHSTTKYIGGHSDVLGGCVVVGEQVSDEWLERLRLSQKLSGGVPSPFDCWLLLRSLPTMPIRVRAQTETAEKVAHFLAQHPSVEAVHYPGLPTHPSHEVARRQMSGFGAMLSVQIKGDESDAMRVAGRVNIFTRATSLGGIESLIEHRASVEGVGGTTPRNLLRISIGLEHVDDLIDDLGQALGK